MDRVVHFEIPAANVKRAQSFYKKTFDWKLRDYPDMGYTIVYTDEIDKKYMPKHKGAINGGMMKRSKKIKSPVITINVRKIEDAITKARKNGGKVVTDKMTVGDMGFAAYIKDTEGNVIGLWQSKMEA